MCRRRFTADGAAMIRRTRLLLASAAALCLLAAACTAAPAGSSSVRRPPAGAPSGTAECTSATRCYTPQQLEVAYGVGPLLHRGIDGRGETVVLPELAESQLSPPLVTDLRQDFVYFDQLFHLPAPRLKVVSTFPGPAHPWLAFGEEVLDAEVVHTIAPRAALTILLVKGTSLDSAGQAVAPSRRAASSPSAQQGRSAASTASTTPSSPS